MSIEEFIDDKDVEFDDVINMEDFEGVEDFEDYCELSIEIIDVDDDDVEIYNPHPAIDRYNTLSAIQDEVEYLKHIWGYD